jgi:putative phage-type endonuclease
MSALVQQTDEWLEVRRDKVGSSDAPCIMGVGFKTPYQLWLEKLSPTKRSPTQAMQRGIDLEDKARECFEKMTGLFVLPQVVFHPDYEWMMASLDGMTIEQDAIVEIKCPGKEDHATAIQGKVPDKYYPQLQHQIEVCGLDMSYYFSFDGEKGVIVKVFRDDKYIKKMITLELEFWNCVQDFTPPNMIEKDYHSKTDDVWTAAAKEWLSINRQLKNLEPREKELRDLLISMANQQNAIGAGVKVSKILRKGSIDYSRIPELQGVSLEPYRKELVECWKISGLKDGSASII